MTRRSRRLLGSAFVLVLVLLIVVLVGNVLGFGIGSAELGVICLLGVAGLAWVWTVTRKHGT